MLVWYDVILSTVTAGLVLTQHAASISWPSCWVSVPPLGLWLCWWLSEVEEHEGPSRFLPLRWPKTWKKNHAAHYCHSTFKQLFHYLIDNSAAVGSLVLFKRLRGFKRLAEILQNTIWFFVFHHLKKIKLLSFKVESTVWHRFLLKAVKARNK